MKAIPCSILLALLCPLLGQADDGQSKIDVLIKADATFVPVFVRMDKQLFGQAGEYDDFCKQKPVSVKRRELRQEVVKTLHTNADQSFAKVTEEVKRLRENGQLRNLQRYWIVNGFACEATGKAVRKLADLESVAFVHRQRFAAQHQRPVNEDWDPKNEYRKLYGKLLAERADDSEQPFDHSKCDVPWNLKRIGADKVWAGKSGLDKGYTGRGVVIAVLDSGLMTAPALTAALWTNSAEKLNGEDDDQNGLVDDVFGYDFQRNIPCTVGKSRPAHATLCAGIIAGRPVADQAKRPVVTGIAPRSKVMPLAGGGQLRAYEYALAHGADILSMSYTWDSRRMGDYRGLFRAAHEHLAAAGVVSVGGAGNYAISRPEGWQIGSPKDIPCVIAAAGVTEDNQVAKASSRGPVSWSNVRYFKSAPDTSLLSKPDVTGCFGGYPMWTRVDVWTGAKRKRLRVLYTDDEGYALALGPRGNSFSGPHAAGVAALMLEANPDLPVWHLKRLMESSCADLGPEGRDTTFGAGMLQADKAVAAAIKFKLDQ